MLPILSTVYNNLTTWVFLSSRFQDHMLFRRYLILHTFISTEKPNLLKYAVSKDRGVKSTFADIVSFLISARVFGGCIVWLSG